MRLLFAAHADGFAAVGVIKARLLLHAAPRFDQRHLPRDFVIQRHFQKAERVEVLDLRLCAQFFRALEPHRDVGVAAQLAFFHVAGRDFDELHDLLQLGQKRVRFVGAAHVGLSYDLGQWGSAAIQIDIGVAVGIAEAFVNAFAGIVFHVNPRDSDALRRAVDGDIHAAMLGNGLVVLGDLIPLGQVGIKIILACKTRERANGAIERSTGNAPGSPMHTGQTLVLGGAPKLVGHPQKILLAVASCTCTSRPTTGSYLEISAGEANSATGEDIGTIIGAHKSGNKIRWATECRLLAADSRGSGIVY